MSKYSEMNEQNGLLIKNDSRDACVNTTIGGTWLHVVTPLVESVCLSRILNKALLDNFQQKLHVATKVYMKLENFQPTRSFKQRGVGLRCQTAVASGAKSLICSSGGNAGLAAAYCARQLNVGMTVCVPSTTPQFIVDLLQAEEAEVKFQGSCWNDAHALALSIVEESAGSVTMIHPFDHQDIWKGNATLVDELFDQMKESPGVIVVSVGGGGLLNGIAQGLIKNKWNNTVIVAMETIGADCLSQSYQKGKIVYLNEITSIAKTLGAPCVSQQTFDYVNSTSTNRIIPCVVNDAQAVNAITQFLDDHGMLVEPACGASLTAIYSNVLIDLVKQDKLDVSRLDSVVVVICGGRLVSLELLKQWQCMF